MDKSQNQAASDKVGTGQTPQSEQRDEGGVTGIEKPTGPVQRRNHLETVQENREGDETMLQTGTHVTDHHTENTAHVHREFVVDQK